MSLLERPIEAQDDLLSAEFAFHGEGAAGAGSVQATNIGAQGFGMGITAINSGINGNTTADIASNVAGRITNYNPNVVVVEIGVNDVADRIDIGTSTTAYNTILTAAWTPLVIGGVKYLVPLWPST